MAERQEEKLFKFLLTFFRQLFLHNKLTRGECKRYEKNVEKIRKRKLFTITTIISIRVSAHVTKLMKTNYSFAETLKAARQVSF